MATLEQLRRNREFNLFFFGGIPDEREYRPTRDNNAYVDGEAVGVVRFNYETGEITFEFNDSEN